jgi:hypothetical protein
LQVEIHSTSSNNPSGTALSNGTSVGVPMSDVSTFGWVNFDFHLDTRPICSADTFYHIVLKSNGYKYGDGINEIIWGVDETNNYYVDGEAETYDGATWTNRATDSDFIFQLYSKQRSVYSSLPEVEALVRHLTNNGTFDGTTSPTAANVMDFEESVADQIDSWFAGAGFTTPVTNTTALNMIRQPANFGVAMTCEQTQRTSGFRGERGADTKVGAFRTIFLELKDSLADGQEFVEALISVGLVRTTRGALGAGLSAGGISDTDLANYQEDDTDLVQPYFKRKMWNNP